MPREYYIKDKFEEFVKKANPHYIYKTNDGVAELAVFSYPGEFNSDGEKPAIQFKPSGYIQFGVLIKSCYNFDSRYGAAFTKEQLLWISTLLKKLSEYKNK